MWRYITPLLWKSWCIRKRHYIYTLLEIILPIGLYVLLWYLRSNNNSGGSSMFVGNETFTPESKEEIFSNPASVNYRHFDIAFTPDDVNTVKRMNTLREMLISRYSVALTSASNASEIENFFFKKYENGTTLGVMAYGVIFHSESSYTLRPVSTHFSTENIFPMFSNPGPGTEYSSYFREGFLLLQIAINDLLPNNCSSSEGSSADFNMTQFPYPAYYRDSGFKSMFSTLIPLITMFGYYVIVPNLITNIIQEKNSGSREWMGMVGLSKIIILLSWVLHSMILYFFTTLINSIILQLNTAEGAILTSTNFFVIWVLLFLFCTSTIFFLLAATAFINNPNIAVIFGSILWILPSVAVGQYQTARNISFGVKVLTCIFPSVTLNWAFIAISGFEANHEKISFSNLFKMHNGQVSDISLGLSLVFFLISIIIYCFAFLYIDSVKPGMYGRSRPWHFIFKPLVNLFQSKNAGDTLPVQNKIMSNFEVVNNLTLGLSFQGIRKQFGPVTAVEDVTIDIYKGQITALLGHNGAGKTTLINIITGMFSPTKGKIWKDGENVFDNFKNFQRNLGLCPQHDLLFPYLNVFEHVTFFGMLRGLSAKKAASDAEELLKFFGISDKMNSLVKSLSGGMKRKLSLSVSLIGNPEILVLDEPTSGMDPESRRDTWNKLLALRGDRTIILTTHYMEEADVLGDMIAIMDHGVIKCYGTSLFLKRQYGSGYKVTLPSGNHEKINQIVKSFIPEHTLSMNGGSNVSYSLPLEKSSIFGELFMEIEKCLPDANSRLNVSCTTMDDVFLKVAHGGRDETDNGFGDEELLFNDSFKGDDIHSSSEALAPKPISGFALTMKRFSALFMKKMLYNYHRWSSWLFLTVFYPLVILVIPLVLTSIILKSESDNPSMAMDLSIYGDTEVLISRSDLHTRLSNSFSNIVRSEGSHAQTISNSTTLNSALLDVGTKNLPNYRFSYIVSASFISNVVNIFYSSLATHSPPIAVNLWYNAYCQSNATRFTTFNHPFNFQDNLCKGGMMITATIPPSIWVFTFPTVLAVISYSFSRLHHDERLNSGKLLQLMTGTSPLLYWFSAFVCDFILFLLSSLLILLYVYVFDSAKLFYTSSDYGLLLMVLILSCISSTWFGYLMSFFLRTFSRLFSINIFLTLLLGELAYFVLTIVKELVPGSADTVNIFNNILMLYPSYCTSSLIFKVIQHLSISAIVKRCFDADPRPEQDSLFTWGDSGINKNLVFLGCDWMIYAALILLTDYGLISKVTNFIFKLYVGPIDFTGTMPDTDVEREKNIVEESLNLKDTHSNVIAHGLGMKYSKKITAVKDVSFLVHKGECFGLLGVNGAGKSTSFKILTGDLLPTNGQAFILGDCLRDNKLKYQSHIGYCPQTDAIIEPLTGYEMLTLYASLRGVNPTIFNRTVSYWISQFGLQNVCNRSCETYSGGNKRKLSTAIALVGDPQVILLDEPTTGVDPVARRKFWAILSKLQKKGSTVILTSHSMDECETVCDRITIMVRGEMRCIGNIQRLKDIYGQGFTIVIQLEKNSHSHLEALKAMFSESFYPHAILRDEHIGLLHYHINCPDYKWSTLFSKMEAIKEQSTIINEYLITETTLEQIFLHFAKL